MPQSRRYLLICLCVLFAIVLAWFFLRNTTPAVPEAIKRGYSEALNQARAGQPGAARVLYQQLGRPDISPKTPRLVACRTAQLPPAPWP